jgi:hypothetical protein
MKNISKEAAKDAFEFASAKMSYGEGAGIRRRHIESAVDFKAARIPGYEEAFKRASMSIDMTKAVKSAKRAGTTRDIGALTSKNVKALARGERHNMSTPLIVGIFVVAVAHQTGYDKKVAAYTKRKTGDVRAWLKRKL